MRKLTAKQKKLLNTMPLNMTCWVDLPEDVMEKLEQINCTEILLSEVDRYLGDRYWKAKTEGKI